jgi:hypothetical protein
LTCAFLWQTYTCNLNLIHATKQKLESGNWKSLFFSKFKRDNSVKNQRTITKFELDLRIPIMYLHMQFQPYTYIQTKVRERKLKISSREITVKSHCTATKFKLDLRNPMMYPYFKFGLNVCIPEIMNGNWNFLFFSKFNRDNSVKNQRTITKFELYLRIPMTYTYKQKVRERKLKKIPRGITLKIHRTATKFKLDLRNPMMYPYIKFE